MRLFLFIILLVLFNDLLAQVNLNQGLIAYYPFNGNANDVTGNNLNGIVRNGAQLTTDRYNIANSAYFFDGIDDYIEISDNGKLSPKAITISALINTETATPQSIVGKIEYSTGFAATYHLGINYDVQYGYFFGVTPFSASCFQQYPYDPSNPFAKTTNSFSTYQWHCLVGTFQDSLLKIYVDGVLQDTKVTNYKDLIQCSNTQLLIGSWWVGDNLKFKGKIDEVRVYDRALNAAEVVALCNTNAPICSGSLGDPVVNTTFGSGNNPAQPLPIQVPGATTNLTYVAVNGNPALPTPVDGQYTISNNTPFNFAWHSGMADHTPNDVNGYLAFYNSQETPGLEFYKQTVNNLCGSTSYEFAAWIANCVNPALLDGVDPDITFRIERPDGTLLAFYNTGPITEETVFTWKQYGFYFVMPPNESTIVLKMINNAVGGTALPGNDLAIDDITFRPCGPTSDASFSDTNSIDTVVICKGTTVPLYGTLSAGFITPNHRWQVSSDDGQTWTDIANANSLQFAVSPAPTNGKYLRYRMASGDGNNINSLNCRIVSNTLYLLVNDTPLGGISGDSVCKGQSGQLKFSTTSGNGPFTLSYSDMNNLANTIQNVNNGTIFPTPGIINSNTTYTLTSIKDANGCTTLTGFSPQQAIVIVKKGVFNAPPNKSVCENNGVQLSGNNGAGYKYLWTPSTYLSDDRSPNPVSTPPASIQYVVTITDPVCSYDSNFQISVTVNPNPIVEIAKSNDIDCSIPTATLQANGALTYVWSPSTNLSNPNSPNPVASPATTTTYQVKGTNSFGCSDTSTVTVNVTNGGKPIFVLPNAFTPNGDGKNDCFGIRRWGNVTVKEFSIFNRWGERVFSTKNPGDCWDGTFKGNKQDTGGYTYVILASSICGEIKKTGIIMLIR